LIGAIKELPSCREEALHRLEEFILGHLPAELAPQQFTGVEPGAVGG